MIFSRPFNSDIITNTIFYPRVVPGFACHQLKLIHINCLNCGSSHNLWVRYRLEYVIWDIMMAWHYGMTRYDSLICIREIWLKSYKSHFHVILVIDGWGNSCKIAPEWMSINLSTIRQHWFRWWFGATGHQAITRVNVDPVLCCHMA